MVNKKGTPEFVELPPFCSTRFQTAGFNSTIYSMAEKHARNTEEEIIEKQIVFSDVKVTFLGLYRYASALDILLLSVYTVCALGAGACQPIPAVRYCPPRLVAFAEIY